jgi:hypothetical protein
MNNQLEQYKGKALVFTSEEEMVDNSIYKTLVTVIEISKDMFHEIKPNFYPKKGLSNQIGSAMGIEFTSTIKMEDVYGDIVEMSDGSKVKKTAGVRCVKQGKRRRPDGSWQLSSPCSYVFNWNDRAELDIISDSEKAGQTWPNGNSKCKYHFPNDLAKQKREQRKHILELKKFGDQRASTGAELMVIRELTGMETSFKDADIKKGKIIVSQIVKSEALQKAEAKAQIDNIRLGGKNAQAIDDAALLLTGSNTNVSKEFEEKFERPDNKKPTTENDTIIHEDKQSGEVSKRDTFDNLLKDETLKSLNGAVDFYTANVMENDYTDEVLDWAISEMTNKIQEAN